MRSKYSRKGCCVRRRNKWIDHLGEVIIAAAMAVASASTLSHLSPTVSLTPLRLDFALLDKYFNRVTSQKSSRHQRFCAKFLSSRSRIYHKPLKILLLPRWHHSLFLRVVHFLLFLFFLSIFIYYYLLFNRFIVATYRVYIRFFKTYQSLRQSNPGSYLKHPWLVQFSCLFIFYAQQNICVHM